MTHEDKLIAVAQAEDTYNLLNHIAWTDVIKPRLEDEQRKLSSMLISEALGTPLPDGFTREQVAGKCYGLKYVSDLFDSILRKGDRALKDLDALGVHLK